LLQQNLCLILSHDFPDVDRYNPPKKRMASQHLALVAVLPDCNTILLTSVGVIGLRVI